METLPPLPHSWVRSSLPVITFLLRFQLEQIQIFLIFTETLSEEPYGKTLPPTAPSWILLLFLPVIGVLLRVSAGTNSNFLNIYGNPVEGTIWETLPTTAPSWVLLLFTCDWCPAGVSAGTNSNFINIYGNPVWGTIRKPCHQQPLLLLFTCDFCPAEGLSWNKLRVGGEEGLRGWVEGRVG